MLSLGDGLKIRLDSKMMTYYVRISSITNGAHANRFTFLEVIK